MTVDLDMHSKRQIAAALHEGKHDALMALGLAGQSYAVRHMSRFSPSAAGDFPAIVTGALVGGLYVADVDDDHKALVSSSDHSLPLEWGTVHMSARPFMRPTAKYLYKNARTIIMPIIAGHLK